MRGSAQTKIGCRDFYGVYHGHSIDHLETVYDTLVARPRASGRDVRVVYLAGDSSLDNKYWLGGLQPATNGMQHVLTPPQSVPDVAAQLNAILQEAQQLATTNDQNETVSSSSSVVCINCAVEESTIGCRNRGKALLPQDVFLRDHVTHRDVVVLSVGGNDIALRPTPSTITSMGWLTCCSRQANITKGSAWGLGHLRQLMLDDVTTYLRALCNVDRDGGGAAGRGRVPAAVYPCVIYYPDMDPRSSSWANKTLGLIGYNKNPSVVQSIIDCIAREASGALTAERVGVPFVQVVPLSRCLDGSDSNDYVARVEPSASGGRKMAAHLWGVIKATAMAPPSLQQRTGGGSSAVNVDAQPV